MIRAAFIIAVVAACVPAVAQAHFPGGGVGQPEVDVRTIKTASFVRFRAVFGIVAPDGCPTSEPADVLSDEWDAYYSEICADYRNQSADFNLVIRRGKKIVASEGIIGREGVADTRVYSFDLLENGRCVRGVRRWTLSLIDPYFRPGHSVTRTGRFRLTC
jgi:hypothetical protein